MKAALPLIGHKAGEARFVSAFTTGRMHHAWIMQGPSGIGKSRLAKRLSAFILGAESPDSPANDPVMQLVLSGGHPDMKWIGRETGDKGKLQQDISVDQIRALGRFFSLQPAMAGWRVAVIDSLDDMNVSSLNALLKTLEEPPANAILILIFHLRRPLAATIRSRCAMLRLNRLSNDETRTVLAGFDHNQALALKLAQGRPGYGMELSAAGGAEGVQAARDLLESINTPAPGIAAGGLHKTFTNTGAFDAFADTMMHWVDEQARQTPALARTWLDLSRTRARAAALNLTHLQTATKLFAILLKDIRDAKR